MLFYISAEKGPNWRSNLVFCHGIFVLDPDPDLYLSIRIWFRIQLLLYKSGSASLILINIFIWPPKTCEGLKNRMKKWGKLFCISAVP